MAKTVQELTDENIVLQDQVAILQLENTRLKNVEEAVKGIVHHIEVHGSTPEDLQNDVIILNRVKKAIADVNPEPAEEPIV